MFVASNVAPPRFADPPGVRQTHASMLPNFVALRLAVVRAVGPATSDLITVLVPLQSAMSEACRAVDARHAFTLFPRGAGGVPLRLLPSIKLAWPMGTGSAPVSSQIGILYGAHLLVDSTVAGLPATATFSHSGWLWHYCW